jgi:hypothetical protein
VGEVLLSGLFEEQLAKMKQVAKIDKEKKRIMITPGPNMRYGNALLYSEDHKKSTAVKLSFSLNFPS